LKRDLKKWEGICKRNKDNGSKGGRPKNSEEPKKPNGLSGNPKEPKKPDSDIDSVIVNDSDSVSEKQKLLIIPYDKILASYHNNCPSLPKLIKLTDSRRLKIKTRWLEIETLEKFNEIFELAGKSKFLNGENDKNWKADFDWIIENDKNWLKILEGRYSKTNQQSIQRPIKLA
jgi:hypothetical protein